jgi:predicted permease
VFLDFTMIGEGEKGAGWTMLLFQGVIMIILGVGLVRLLWAGREKKS